MVKCLYKAFQTVHSFEIISRDTFDFNISQQCTIVRILLSLFKRLVKSNTMSVLSVRIELRYIAL